MFSVIVPTYNERKNITEFVERVEATLEDIEHELIVVDDDSPDGTWELAQELAEDNPNLKVIRRTNEKGLATAVVRGLEEANGEKLAVIDADLQHPPQKLLDIYEKLIKNYDIVVASRNMEGGGVEEWPWYRKAVSKGAELISRVFLPSTREITDPMSGFFGLDRSVIEDKKLEPEGYKILLEILEKGDYDNTAEIPYTFENREKGSSALGTRQYINYLKHVFKLARSTGELTRLIKFCLVGLSGVLVNMSVLFLLTDVLSIFYLLSGLFAVESAITTNFVLNELWTFGDRSGSTIPHRYLKFQGISIGGLIINLSVLFTLTEFLSLHYLLSNLIGIAGATAWNFSMNTLHTWKENV